MIFALWALLLPRLATPTRGTFRSRYDWKIVSAMNRERFRDSCGSLAQLALTPGPICISVHYCTREGCMGGDSDDRNTFWLAGSMVADAAYPLAPQSNRQSDGETQQVGVEADEIQSAVELGRRVAARYRDLPYLALSGMVEETQNNHVLAQVYFEAEMADGRHLLNATLAAGVLTISFSDGCVREEFRPRPRPPTPS